MKLFYPRLPFNILTMQQSLLQLFHYSFWTGALKQCNGKLFIFIRPRAAIHLLSTELKTARQMMDNIHWTNGHIYYSIEMRKYSNLPSGQCPHVNVLQKVNPKDHHQSQILLSIKRSLCVWRLTFSPNGMPLGCHPLPKLYFLHTVHKVGSNTCKKLCCIFLPKINTLQTFSKKS